MEKCGEIFRLKDSGSYWFICYHCGLDGPTSDGILQHINESHLFADAVDHKDEEDGHKDDLFASLFIKTELNSSESVSINRNEIVLSEDNSFDVIDNPKNNRKRKRKVFDCNECKEKFISKKLLDKHKDENHHEIKEPISTISSISEPTYYVKQELKFETSKPLLEQPVPVVENRPVKKNKISDSNAIQKPKKKELKQHICELCSKEFNSSSNLRNHMIVHASNRPFICDICSKQFHLMSRLRRHINVIHCNKRTHKCKVCSKGYGEAHTLRNHLLTHNKIKPFKCEICDKTFAYSASLKTHSNIHSNENKPYLCAICSKSFSQLGNLKLHMELHGDQEKRFFCTICEQGFVRKLSLKSHMLVHEPNERNFKCPVCNKKFRYKQSLHRHKLIHKNDRKFICDICTKGFCVPSDLRRHQRVHTDERPFICTVCPLSFKRADHLGKHLRSHNLNSVCV